MGMRYVVFVLLWLFTGCSSQSIKPNTVQVSFEDISHFEYPLTDQPYLVIDTQKKMDEVYAKIHKNTLGNRLAPIPLLAKDEVYLALNVPMKKANDVVLQEVVYGTGKMYITVSAFNNENLQKSFSGKASVLVKMLMRKPINDIKIIYKTN